MVWTKRMVPVLALIAGLMGGAAVKADQLYNFNFQGVDTFGDKLTLSGQITASSTTNGSGSYDIESITGTWLLVPFDAPNQVVSLSISGLSTAFGNNVIVAGNPYLNGTGVGFVLPGGYPDTRFFYNSSASQYCDFIDSDSGNACGTGTITPVVQGTPEPGTMMLVALGLVLGTIAFRRAG